jgi:pyroglutamyl-peptidase
MRRRPRILVTGFSAFPGAPVNPTERLILELEARRSEFHRAGELSFAVLDVDYAKLPVALSHLGKAQPNIAIHFGLSAQAHGFTLERCARNAFGPRPDNAGHVPVAGRICAGPDRLTSGLPLERLHEALVARGLPASWSDDAGGYLCNYLFYLSRSDTIPEFAPEMSGFIHVPPLAGGADAPTMSLEMLMEGAILIIRACAAAWDEESV